MPGCAVSHGRTIDGPFCLVALVAESTFNHIDRSAAINFTALVAFLHLTDLEDLKDNLHIGGILQTPLGVTSDCFQLGSSDSIAFELADDVEQ